MLSFVLCAGFLRRSLDSRLSWGFSISYFSSSRSLVGGVGCNARELVVHSSLMYFVVTALLFGFRKRSVRWDSEGVGSHEHLVNYVQLLFPTKGK